MRTQLTFQPATADTAPHGLVLFGTDDGDLTECKALAAQMGVHGQPTTLRLARPSGADVVVGPADVLVAPVTADVVRWLIVEGGARSNPASVRTFAVAARIALSAVGSHHLLPTLRMSGDQVIAGWRVDVDADPAIGESLTRLAEVMPASVTALAVDDDHVIEGRQMLEAFCGAVAQAMVHAAAPPPSGRPRQRLLPWTARWTEAAGDGSDPVVPLRDDGPDLVAGVEGWQARDDVEATLVLTLTAPDEATGPWDLAFGVRDEDDEVVPAGSVFDDPGLGLGDALLAGLSRAARAFPTLDSALAGERPERVTLSTDEAWELLVEVAPLLQGAGIDVVLPTELSEEGLTAQIRLDDTDEGDIEATWEVLLADRVLDDAEVADLAETGRRLAFHNDGWVLLDDDTRAALATRGRSERLTRAEGLALALAGAAGDEWFGEGSAAQRVVADGALADLLESLRTAGDLIEVDEQPDGFEGTLRPYQQRGVAWLHGMAELGMGAVLADAMGLGKTIQLIGLLLRRTGPFLVVCPTSVVGNWQREIERFAPSLSVIRHHGVERPTELDGFEGVLVTSYGTLRRDVDLLSGLQWNVVALDEAQQVKNPETAAAQAVRSLDAEAVFALTGTPLENRLTELWAVIDATNRGLLGTRSKFSRRFVGPVENNRDADAADRLRRLVSPFIMRRTKDDPEIARDLPDKIERTLIASLTREQADLYAKVTKDALEQLAEADGIGRRGKILALLTALKQVTNHPAQYLKEDGPISGRSGKMTLLREIVAEATDAGDQMLIFTQFTRMGDLLVEQLGHDLGTDMPFLHGGLSLKQRDRMVADFQHGSGSPVLIISTRAGGTGLNLTAATHVVHYDRWWNPAVEDQATDRAHRIGQTRNVEVHKLVTAGTIEERIAEMLDRKRALADAVVGAGETWITELDDEALLELVSLSSDAPVAEADDDDELFGSAAPGSALGGAA